jgi:hypothetical protein
VKEIYTSICYFKSISNESVVYTPCKLLSHRSNKPVETPVAEGLDYPHHRSDGEVITSASQAANLPSCGIKNQRGLHTRIHPGTHLGASVSELTSRSFNFTFIL